MARVRSGKAVVIVVVVLLVVIAGCGAAWWFLLRPTPEAAIEQFVAAADAKDMKKARSFMTQETLQAGDEFQKQIQTSWGGMMPQGAAAMDMAVITGYQMLAQSESVGKAKIEGNTATLSRKMKGPMGGTASATQDLKLVKEGGKWKIDMAEQLRMASKFMKAMPGFAQGVASAAKGMAEEMAPATGETPAAAPAEDAATLVSEAAAAKKAGKVAEASAKYRQALAREPNNVDAHWGLAWVLAGQKKNSEAVTHFEQVVKIGTDQKKATEAKSAIARLK